MHCYDGEEMSRLLTFPGLRKIVSFELKPTSNGTSGVGCHIHDHARTMRRSETTYTIPGQIWQNGATTYPAVGDYTTEPVCSHLVPPERAFSSKHMEMLRFHKEMGDFYLLVIGSLLKVVRRLLMDR